VSLSEDTAIDRLFELSAERAAEERGVAMQADAAKPATGSKPKSPGRKQSEKSRVGLRGRGRGR
jgi:hypothetical protein